MSERQTSHRTISLADAVIKQAWDDVMNRVSAHKEVPIRLQDSWRFLTETHGEWAESRHRWCEIAGRCPEALRRSALAHRDRFEAVYEGALEIQGRNNARKREQHREKRV